MGYHVSRDTRTKWALGPATWSSQPCTAVNTAVPATRRGIWRDKAALAQFKRQPATGHGTPDFAWQARGSGVRIPDAPPLLVELKIGSQRQRVPSSGLKMDPLPGQGVTGALNWALDIQIHGRWYIAAHEHDIPRQTRVNSMPSRVELALRAARRSLASGR